MEKVVPWPELVALVSPYLPEGKRGRPPFPCETMLRIHFMQQWYALSDPAMEETGPERHIHQQVQRTPHSCACCADLP